MRNRFSSSPNHFMKHISSFFVVAFTCFYGSVSAQPGAEVDLKKPERYENRTLRSEKTGEKKFTLPRRILSNTTTHYNYYFNANTRLNDVIEKAKTAHKDDYSQLLPFYNYSLTTTAQDKVELDSIIYKSTAGILLHDLRNDWVDNMYLLLAKSYFFRNDLDSASLTLQYINYAFAPKEDGYDIPIGSNASNETGEFSIATKENKGVKKLITHQPSRNESFLWQVRTFIERGEYPEAAGIMEILRNDPNFPKRLQTELDETAAYWFYKQNLYDSAAVYLSKALTEAGSGQEKARWEYLIAQMYHLAGNYDDAVKFYERSIKHTADPVMDVYARLNAIKINRGDTKDYLQHNIDELVKMARRDKYTNYRDIIYFAAAAIELERNGFDNAQNLLLKSIETSSQNPQQRNRSFLLLGDLNFNRKAYANAFAFYDSIDVNTLVAADEKERVTARKPPLQLIAENDKVIHRNDSLQQLAAMPAEKRDAILKKMVRQIRKENGLKDDDTQSVNPAITQQQPVDLFGKSNKGNDFYFYNASQKAAGFNEFRSKWGDRPNIDNWRRMAAVNRAAIAALSDIEDPAKSLMEAEKEQPASYEDLLKALPLTESQISESNTAIGNALFSKGTVLLNKLEDYPSAIEVFEELLRRFPDNVNAEEAMFSLVYAYEKTGDKAKADTYRNKLIQKPESKFARLLQTPSTPKQSAKETAATRKYEEIYNHFIEGRFEEAVNEKRLADSAYGKTYWTPQLLFIEAIHYVKQRDDSTAIKVLTELEKLDPSSALAGKAKNMIGVLSRRSEIEDYLAKLELPAEQSASPSTGADNTRIPATQSTTPVVNNTVKDKSAQTGQPPVQQVQPVKKDTAIAPRVINASSFNINEADQHFVVVLLDKVDVVYANEARNAFNRYNRETFYNQKIDVSSFNLNERFNLLLQGPFENAAAAISYIDKAKPVARGRILPWLATDKYSFIIISGQNLDTLKGNKEMDAYQQLLRQVYPGKF